MTTEPTLPPVALPTKRQVLIGSAVASVVAAVALVFFVLPAEMGVDPTGFGKATGLTGLANPGGGMNIYQVRGAKRKGVLTLSETPIQRDWADRWQVELLPYEAIELKYSLEAGQAMEFSWQGTDPLYYDMHSYPFAGGDPLTETYSLGEARRQQGRYVAAFTGNHGWYWQNRTLEPVTLTLEAAGPMTESTLFVMGIPRARALTPPQREQP